MVGFEITPFGTVRNERTTGHHHLVAAATAPEDLAGFLDRALEDLG